MDKITDYITPGGQLDSHKILRREVLYQGMNGNLVERFYVDAARSYIFKPLTHEGQNGRENWVYEHILPWLPPVYPRMLAKSQSGNKGESWAVFEDLGSLTHVFDVDTALNVVKEMACWHAIPRETWPEGLPVTGQKPRMETLAAEILERAEEVRLLLGELGLPETILLEAAERFTRVESGTAYFKFQVLSHGDLHTGNYATVFEKLYILDWEHAHLNTIYWDLYHLLDMSHPLFPKQMTVSVREKVLDYYMAQSASHGKLWDRTLLLDEYCQFAALFSIWMLLLIRSDLKREKAVWTVPQLQAQWDETVDTLIQSVTTMQTGRQDMKLPGHGNNRDKAVGE